MWGNGIKMKKKHNIMTTEEGGAYYDNGGDKQQSTNIIPGTRTKHNVENNRLTNTFILTYFGRFQ